MREKCVTERKEHSNVARFGHLDRYVVDHITVEVSGADWRICVTCGGGRDRSNQWTSLRRNRLTGRHDRLVRRTDRWRWKTETPLCAIARGQSVWWYWINPEQGNGIDNAKLFWLLLTPSTENGK